MSEMVLVLVMSPELLKAFERVASRCCEGCYLVPMPREFRKRQDNEQCCMPVGTDSLQIELLSIRSLRSANVSVC